MTASSPPRPIAAHFLLVPELLHSPPNEAIISALLETGHDVHVFAPGPCGSTAAYGERVTTHPVAYSMRWLLREAWRPRWGRYACFSGTTEDPIALVGVLARLHRRPSFVLGDEIRAGSYRGPRSPRWKQLCIDAYRRACFTIVNDTHRVPLVREYAGLPPSRPVLVYPGCFRNPPERDPQLRLQLRRDWGIGPEALTLAISGGFNLTAGADWLLDALHEDSSLCAVIQPLGVDPLALYLLRRLSLGGRLHIETERLSWQEAWRSAVGYDIGLAVYTNPAPQFQAMGVSSNRLCMYLAMGVPVICSRQSSFQFVEDFGCGVMVDDGAGFLAATHKLGADLEARREDCARCFHDYIRPRERYRDLVEAIGALAQH
jgi:glycosyltransferase involved in cell wall biosynthesis